MLLTIAVKGNNFTISVYRIDIGRVFNKSDQYRIGSDLLDRYISTVTLYNHMPTELTVLTVVRQYLQYRQLLPIVATYVASYCICIDVEINLSQL